MENNDQSDSVYRVGLPECAIVRPSIQMSFKRSISLTVAPWSRCRSHKKKKGKKSSCLGMKKRGGGLVWGEDYLAVSKFPYEQGGSSDGVRGPQEGTVLRDRKAKMEGS